MQTKSHLSVLIHKQAEKYGNKVALTYKAFGSTQWNSVSWNEFSLRVKQVSNAFLHFNLHPQEIGRAHV